MTMAIQRFSAKLQPDTDKRGIAIVEFLISLAIVSITISSVYSLYVNHLKAYTTEGVTSRIQQSVRSSLNFMVQDIRAVGLDPARTGDFVVEDPSPQKFRFKSDRDMDGELDEPNLADGLSDSDLEHMAFEYDGSSRIQMVLYRLDGTEEFRDTLVDNVSSLSFSYRNESDSETTNPEEVRAVVVALTIEKPAGREGFVSRTLEKRIHCRNLYF